MYISELNLHGFKSFAKKEKIKFGEGVTVIVGPNGCGKTNIVDAIRWVLGEQKYSVLRSGKMGDVIFNGADGHKPLSVCEAYLTVHNNRGKLPIEYNDIEIGRRVYRDGESEYFINKTPCRLKDIHNLFVDTGMGSDAYSVIELKMIEQILSETAEDRKRMFEEAAGINKYKQQRQSALRKFDAVQRDLDRVDDIIQEVEQKVKNLNLQLKRFKRHEKLSSDLLNNELALAYIRVHDYESELIPLRKSVLESRVLKNEKKTDTSLLEKELQEIKNTYLSQQEELRDKQHIVEQFEKKRESSQSNILIWNEQLKSSEMNVIRLSKELESSKHKRSLIKDRIIALEKDFKALEPQINKLRVEYDKKSNNFKKIENEYSEAKEKVNYVQAQRWEAQDKILENRSVLDKSISLIEEKSTVLKHLEKKIKNLKAEELKFSKDQLTIDKSVQKQSEIVEKLSTEIDNLNTQLKSNHNMSSSLEIEINNQKSKLVSLQGNKTFFQELIEQKEGYPDGAKTILENPTDYNGLIGAIGDLFQFDAKFESAFQSALGTLAQCLVSKDRKSAMNILKMAQKRKLGDFSIFPLKELESFKVDRPSAPKIEGVIGPALNFCSIPKAIQGLGNGLIGNLLIVKDISKVELSKISKEWDVVDLNGAFFGMSLLIKYQSKPKKTSVIGRKKKIAKLEKDSITLEKKITDNVKKLKKIGIEILKSTDDKESKDQQLSKENSELVKLQSDQIKNHYKQSQILSSISESKKEEKVISKELDLLRKTVDEVKPSLLKNENQIKSYKKDLQKVSEIYTSAQFKRDSYQQKVQEQRIDLLNMDNKLKSLSLQIESSKKSFEEYENRDVQIQKETTELMELKKSLDEKIVHEESSLDGISANIVQEKSVLDLKQQAASTTFESMQKIQEKINSEQQMKEALLEQQKENELRIVELEQIINGIKERMMDKYNSKIPKDMKVDNDVTELEVKIDTIQRGLKNIGPLNMAAQQDYQEEQDRLQNLLEQRVDILESEENLKETIAKIDVVAREKFESTFEKIDENFSNMFGMFFDGGSASLGLTGSDDPLEAQIVIHAQPPGKKNQNLRMLSAGEKSLTAIALLFAIYQFKPSPYCVLDEIDAPLDDVNIQKFKKVLNQFAQETQFIVVTHNKLTMEAADYLYGVTMEKKGVSKLVSVKFKGEA